MLETILNHLAIIVSLLFGSSGIITAIITWRKYKKSTQTDYIVLYKQIQSLFDELIVVKNELLTEQLLNKRLQYKLDNMIIKLDKLKTNIKNA